MMTMKSQSKNLEDLWKDVRLVKNDLIKASKILLHELEQQYEIQPENRELYEQIVCIAQRVDYLQEEVMNDFRNKMEYSAGPANSILQNALRELKLQFEKEKRIFDEDGENADKLLDMHFRIKEIESSLQTI